jgi:signal transduction histidine kinase
MPDGRALLRHVLGALLLWAGLLPGGAQASAGGLLELRSARVITTVDGVSEPHAAELPYHWDRRHQNRSGEAVFEVPFTLPAQPTALYGIYFPRIGNRAEVWLNGTLLSRYGRIRVGSSEDYAKAPQYLLVPANLLREENLLHIVIEADDSRRGGLSAPRIGPAEVAYELFRSDYRWRVTGSLAVAVFSLVVGTIALVLWMTQRDEMLAGDADARHSRDGLYLSAGLAELFWVVRLSDLALEHPPLPWHGWNVAQVLVFAGWMCGAGLFCHHVAGWHRRPSMRWVKTVLWGLFLTAAPLAYAALAWHNKLFLTSWYGAVTFLFIGYGTLYLAAAFRHPSAERTLVTAAGVLNIAVGLRDWLVIRAHDNFDEVTWIRYSSVMFGMALLYIVVTRFRRSREQARDLMDNMAAKVHEKELALAASYRQLEQLAREQERAAERTRILRDMHDGVGSHISAAIRQLQSGKASAEQLLQTLRDSLDQLKLSIDAMNLPPGDLTALLATLRYRLEPRFKASDIELQWDVALVPPLERLDARAMRQLQFMVFEALSNVLQHAQASELRIELRALPGGAQLRVVDNGRGFDVARGQRRGLGSLQERAVAIGARLDIASGPGGTVVEIVLD